MQEPGRNPRRMHRPLPQQGFLNSDVSSVSFAVTVTLSGPGESLIYDIRRRIIRSLRMDASAPGTGELHWDGRNWIGAQVVSGVYFYQIKTGGAETTARLVMLR